MGADDKINAFFATAKTGVVADAMRLLGIEGWMEGIFPFKPEARVYGRAFTMKTSPYRGPGVEQKTSDIHDLVGKWNKGDIIVIDGGGTNRSIVGDVASRLCRNYGAGGIVIWGKCRDYSGLRELDLSIFGTGAAIGSAISGNLLRYTDYNVPVNIAGTQVHPGDYIFGDADGVLVIPANYVNQVVYQAEMLSDIEKELDKALEDRLPIEQILPIMKKRKIKRV
jgi:4-hydroxy-4-methyl-2-oxoglutarate aldolase